MEIERIESGPSCMDATRTDCDAELAQRQADEREARLNKVLNGIRLLELTSADVRQIIDTLTATMQVQRFPYRAIEALDIASEDV